jgi:transcription elongation factor Elf1
LLWFEQAEPAERLGAASHGRGTMIRCPQCGHVMLEGQVRDAKIPRTIACSWCEHLWEVATLEPTRPAEVDQEEQRAETD